MHTQMDKALYIDVFKHYRKGQIGQAAELLEAKICEANALGGYDNIVLAQRLKLILRQVKLGTLVLPGENIML